MLLWISLIFLILYVSRETALQKVIFEFQVCAQVCKAKVLSGTKRKLDGVRWVKEEK